MNSKHIVLNLDATDSLISSTSPISLAEMIRSDHNTTEISHFLNKWCLSVKLFTTMELKIKKVEINFSWAMIHSIL